MSISPEAIKFEDIHRSMAIFVEGIYGQSLHLEALENGSKTSSDDHGNSDGDDPRYIDGSPLPQADRIFAPNVFDRHPTRAQNLAECQVTLLRQIEYLNGGTLLFKERVASIRAWSIKSELLRPPEIVATQMERRFALFPSLRFINAVFERLEVRRIDEYLLRTYPGSLLGLRQLRQLSQGAQLLQRAAMPREAHEAAHDSISIESFWQWFVSKILEDFSVANDDESLSHRLLPEARNHAKNLQVQILKLAAVVTLDGSSLKHSAKAAIDICELTEAWFRSFPGQLGANSTELASELESEREASTPPNMTSFGRADGQHNDPGSDRAGSGSSDDQYADDPGPALEAHETKLGEQERTTDKAIKTMLRSVAKSFLYDEWDYTAARYLSAWCRVIEHKLQGEDTEFILTVRRRHPKLWRQLRRSFAALRPTNFKRVHHASDGEDLDLDRLIQRHSERRLQQQEEDGFFIRRERTLRDVSVAFLVDMSASTSILIPEAQALEAEHDKKDESKSVGLSSDSSPDYPYLYGGGMSAQEHHCDSEAHAQSNQARRNQARRVIDAAQDAVALMCEALHHLGDDFAVYGFSGDGREKVDFYIAKEFHEPLSARTWGAVAAMQPKQSSRVGPAIRHSSHKILKHASGRRLLIVISDGYPQDQDYGPNRDDVEYGIQDTAGALREAERQGIQTFFVTIDPAGYDYLGRMCPVNRYLLIEDVAELPSVLSQIYQAMKFSPSAGPPQEHSISTDSI